MVRFVFISFVLLFSIVFSKVLEWGDENDGGKDFEQMVKENSPVIAKFFAPWCGHCKRLAPVWDSLGEEMSNVAKVVKVDCTSSGKDTCEKQGVRGFPTIKFFKWDKEGEKMVVIDYEKDRSLTALTNFVSQHSLPPVRELTDENIKKSLKSPGKPTFVVFTLSSSSDLLKAVEGIASSFMGISDIYFSHSKKHADMYDASMETVVFFPAKNQIGVSKEVRPFVDKVDKVKEFVKEQTLGFIPLRTPSLDVHLEKPVLTIFSTKEIENDPSSFKLLRVKLMELSKQNPNVKIAVGQFRDYYKFVESLGVDLRKDYIAISYETGDGKKFIPSEFDGSTSDVNSILTIVKKFMEEIALGNLQPYIRSMPIPKNDDPNVHVTQVVGKTFDEIVMDNSKDVLIKIYAPWCGHCKNLAPIYEELAEKLKDEPNLLIAEIDATTNDIPDEYSFSGFPTIFFAPVNKKHEPVKYEGARTVDAFHSWLSSHVSTPLKSSHDEL